MKDNHINSSTNINVSFKDIAETESVILQRIDDVSSKDDSIFDDINKLNSVNFEQNIGESALQEENTFVKRDVSDQKLKYLLRDQGFDKKSDDFLYAEIKAAFLEEKVEHKRSSLFKFFEGKKVKANERKEAYEKSDYYNSLNKIKFKYLDKDSIASPNSVSKAFIKCLINFGDGVSEIKYVMGILFPEMKSSEIKDSNNEKLTDGFGVNIIRSLVEFGNEKIKPQSKVVLFIGDTGVGKSTLLNYITGAEFEIEIINSGAKKNRNTEIEE